MGYFLAVSAVRTDSVRDVARAITDLMQSHDVKYEVLPGSTTPDPATDALVFRPVNGWVVVLWPEHFNIHDFPLIRSIASSRAWLVLGVHVYDSDYWEHLAVQGSTELHSFCSRPRYWADAPEELARMATLKPGPGRLCTALGVPERQVSRYLADVDALPNVHAKAYDGDAFEIGDFWVFTDFWRALGITYPDPPSGPEVVVRLSRRFSRRLPSA